MVWQKAHKLFLQLTHDVEAFPRTKAATIVADQLLRSVGSISANIAEGFGRRTGAEYVHYLIVARGSTTEIANWFMKCRDLAYFPPPVACRSGGQLPGDREDAEHDDWDAPAQDSSFTSSLSTPALQRLGAAVP